MQLKIKLFLVTENNIYIDSLAHQQSMLIN